MSNDNAASAPDESEAFEALCREIGSTPKTVAELVNNPLLLRIWQARARYAAPVAVKLEARRVKTSEGKPIAGNWFEVTREKWPTFTQPEFEVRALGVIPPTTTTDAGAEGKS